jgi:hypothetical protein
MPEPINFSVKETGKTHKRYAVVGADEQQIAVFTSQSDAYDYRQWKAQTPDQRLEAGLCAVRQDYYQDVRDTAESIKAELEGQLKDKECGETLREWLLEHIHETIDGSSRVIYTQSAMLGLFASDNDGAYFDQFGEDGAVTDGCINWSALCFSAFEADVQKHLDAIGVDVNSPVPDCDDCGTDDQDGERYQVGNEADGYEWLCEECKEAREKDSKPDDGDDAEITVGASVVLVDDPNGTVFTVLSIEGEDVSVSVPGSADVARYESYFLQIAAKADDGDNQG